MPENTKQKKKIERKRKEKPFNADEKSRRPKERERSYYYDDAHGYEIYNPDKDIDERVE
jgi:hypothetical protein